MRSKSIVCFWKVKVTAWCCSIRGKKEFRLISPKSTINDSFILNLNMTCSRLGRVQNTILGEKIWRFLKFLDFFLIFCSHISKFYKRNATLSNSSYYRRGNFLLFPRGSDSSSWRKKKNLKDKLLYKLRVNSKAESVVATINFQF